MSRSHMKRLPTPKTWRINRKERKYTTRPYPGGHSFEFSMSLNTVMIELGMARTKKEVKHLLQNGEITVDGKKQHDEKRPVGFMDVLTIPKAKKSFRLIVTEKGMQATEIDDKEAKIKLAKIRGKSSIKGGKTQVHTNDGRNITLVKEDYKVGDTLLIEIPSQKVKEHLPLKKGATILLYKGNHAGVIGQVEEVEGRKIIFKTGKDKFETRKAYAFVIGKDKPALKVTK